MILSTVLNLSSKVDSNGKEELIDCFFENNSKKKKKIIISLIGLKTTA